MTVTTETHHPDNKTPDHQPLRLGVLGCAGIARGFVRDTLGMTSAVIAAVASRDLAKAQAFASTFDIQRAYGSYEALLDDPAVDAIYIPLPNTMHAEWAIRAAQAGKHVLCEKPLAVGPADAAAMFAAARTAGVMLLEAYPYWFQPATALLRELLADSAIGTIRSAQACFGFTVQSPESNIRVQAGLGGGSLLDAGTYAASIIRIAMGEAPERVSAESTWTTGMLDDHGAPLTSDRWTEQAVDIDTSATLFYANGRRAQLSCAMNAANHRGATLIGSNGTIETEYLNHTGGPGHPYQYLSSQLRLRRGIANTIEFEELQAPTGSGFRFTLEAFAEMVRTNDVATVERYATESLDIAATLAAIALSARTGTPQQVQAIPAR